MNEEKLRLRLSVTPEVMEFIKDIKEDHHFGNNGDVISYIVMEYKRLKNEQWSLNYITEAVMKTLTDSINENLREELKRIRLGTNNTDRNTQIIIELFNGLMFNQNINDIITTDVLEQPGIKTAREFVQEQIENKRQRRLDWESKQKKK
ncbi:hypothetical protein [Bacillus sp. AFS055030]|uniref:hypothetical protein n=1 Tax=Bacillus sp. AFS055030 TaxID=2033507 RepID=UPI000BFE16DE|nr:hypothetical protein [Bacillus sp. AFS055030]PGL72074.1 hypothetical protein CN925_05900 [Bacillus sp. AFS055030]